jgi:cytochrome c2
VWKSDANCFVLRVSAVTGTWDAVLVSGGARWRTVFETSPCLPLKSRGRPFNGSQSGGRMLLLDDNTLLLTVGDHEFDGVHADEALAQDSAGSYGKTVLVDLRSGVARTYTSGHRNAQGLARRGDGTIWLTEHGPSGGDELNLLVESRNYGWPLETYGTEYGLHFWPLSDSQGRHTRFTPPAFSWLPSVGISSVMEIAGPPFSLWDGDLLVASLVRKTLYRVRLLDGRVQFVEPIPIGERIRDMTRGLDGAIVLWLDRGGIAVLDASPIEATTGEAHFAALCGSCHMTFDGTAHGVGPDLAGVASRRVASAVDYQYSDALKRMGGRWTAGRLDDLLREGSRFAPGMAMPELVIDDPAIRSAIVEYVRTLR